MLAKFRSTNIMGLASMGFFGSLAAGFSYISGLQSARTVEGKKTALPALALWAGDYDGMQSHHVIRFLVPYSKTIFFIDRGEQLGTAAEWAEEFDKWVNKSKKAEEFDKWVNKSKKSEIERMRVVFYRRPATNYSPR
jgi:hypothetical protein